MLDYAQLQALAAVHRRGSFEAAAAQLGLTPSAISLRIKGLEDRMGALLIRRGQPCRATDAGLDLVRHFEQVMVLEGALPLRDAPLTRLRIAVNADSLATWVIPALAEVPGVLFDLVIDDQDVSQEWLRRGEVQAAITGQGKPLQGCDTLSLGRLRYRATASPGFVARWLAGGVTPQTLTRAPGLSFSDHDRLQALWVAARFGAGARRLVLPSHRIASSQGFVDACLAGLGWGMNPENLIRPHLHSGALTELIAGTVLDVPLFWQAARATAGAIAPLTRAIRQAAAAHLV